MSALSERITAARKAAKVSQQDAALCIKVSRPTYIAIEKGERDVKADELAALAALFKTPVSRLVRQDSPPPQIAPHLRGEVLKAGQDAGLEEAINKLADFVDDYQFLLAKTHTRQLPPMAPVIPEHSGLHPDTTAARAAQAARSHLGLGSREPIGNLRKTLDEIGVHVFVESLNSRLAGLYTYVQHFGYCILVNRKHPIERMRWTIAHEFGHFLFDRDKPGVDYTEGMARKPLSERLADAFAANFLMPAEGVRNQFEDAKVRHGDVNVGDVCRMADFYGVSVMAMTLRLEAMRLIPQGTWNSLMASGVRVGEMKKAAGIVAKSEKPDIDVFPERYLLLAIQAWNNEEISTSQFAKLVRRPVIEARELAEQRSMVDDEEGPVQVQLGQSVLERSRPSA